jgi:hypothetical protein
MRLFLSLAVIALPAVIIFFLSRISGWSALAQRYPLRGGFPKPKKRFGYGFFRGWVGYNGGIIVGSDQSGLYLRAMPVILSFCHAPIYIPWREVSAIDPLSGWIRGYRIRTAQAANVNFAMRPQTFAVIRHDAKSAGVSGE